MADNANATAGDGSLVIAADDVGGVLYQRIKLNLGTDGSAQDVNIGQQTKTASVPVVLASNDDAVTVLGTTSDAAIDTDTTGSVSGKLRGIVKLLNSNIDTSGFSSAKIAKYGNIDTSLVPSASRATGNSNDRDVFVYSSLTAFLNVTVAPGTSLDVYLKTKDPISGNYATIGQYAQVTTTGTWILTVNDPAALGQNIRFEWIVSGSNPTFSIGLVLKG